MLCSLPSIVGNLGGTKIGDWQILIWQICGHVPFSMHIKAQNGRFLFW